MNLVMAAGVVFLVVGIGVQAYGIAQIAPCAYSSPPKSSCGGGLTVTTNGISLFLILVGLVAIIRTRQQQRGEQPQVFAGPKK